MRKHAMHTLALPTAIALFFVQNLAAQNSSPYWSLAGNSNASTSSKLGTTNSIPLRILTNNTVRMYVSPSAGYVGIGTTSPSARLHVNAASGTSPLKVAINGSYKLYIASNGYVGINTSSPAYNLHVNGNASVSNGLRVGDNGVYGYNLLTGGPGVYGKGTTAGVQGESIDGAGIYTVSTNSYGVNAFSTNGIGIAANSTYNWGIISGGKQIGTYGSAFNNSGTAYGLYGYGSSSGSNSSDIAVGVYGTAYSSTFRTPYGVMGEALNGVYGVSSSGGGNALRAYTNQSGSYGVNAVSTQSIGVYAYTGNSASYAGYFIGRVYSTGGYTSSDRKLKQNIEDVSDAMTIINKLQPKTYTFRQDGNYKLMNLPLGKHYGLIAQDVEQVLPDLVANADFNTARVRAPKPVTPPAGVPVNPSNTQTNTGGAGIPEKDEVIDFKTLNYTELIPIMVKAMQEQQKKIDELQALVNKLLQDRGTNTITSMGMLSQNSPNPAKSTTRITYTLPTTSGRAQLLLTDNLGKRIRVVSLNSSGTLDLNTAALSSGIYNYSLMVDGKIVETKKMEVLR